MNVTVIGTGYVGLVTGACLSQVGNNVICIDNDAGKVDRLKQGEIPIYEPGLDAIVAEGVRNERLHFTTDIAAGVAHGDILFIAVGTPPDEDGSADLQHVLAVARDIGRNLSDYRVIVTKSTVPVGTSEKVKAAVQSELDQRGAEIPFSVVSNPEFLKEGAAVEDFMKPDRIIVGTEDQRAEEMMRDLYAPFNRNHDRVIMMDIRSAEMTKYAANAMLATKISFMNEMANLAEKLGVDIEAVRRGIGSDPRIGYHFIYPGCGYGGSCFPKDVKALHRTARENGYEARLLDAVEAVNEDQKSSLLNKLDRYFDDLSGKKIAIWGLAFKPETDDIREAPSRVIMEGLWQRGASVAAYDPAAMEEIRHNYPGQDGLELTDEPYAALQDADALLVVTEWKAFRSPDFERIKSDMRGNVIFDGRNIYDPEHVRDAGLDYFAIGRP
ncbi:MAG: UDP-glucose 6-dehydrogenase [Gammaproteobacteria bacterium]|nr:MAG: UDP-glucose 6-dehydrogenase [Gammaproteobacteria bacterium]